MTQEGFKRKLTAILSADVEGYSRLMDDDEEATVRTLTAYRTAINDLTQQYRGRVVDNPGDNVLAEFTSVVDAVNCAVEIQRELAERNAELAYNRKMEFRIGINLGDVIEEEGRIYGDGVNIAARVESLSEAGGICISGRAYDQVANKLGLEYENLGEHQVKNISTPIRAYRVLSFPGAAAHRVVKAKETVGKKWRKIAIVAGAVVVVVAAVIAGWQYHIRLPEPVEAASLEEMKLPLPDKPSIAVLAFDNMSGDPEDEYIANGIAEDIITAISKIDQMFVISRNSTFTYKGRPVKVKQVSEEFGVQYVLEGSIQRSGDRLRVTAQLIDALTGHHLWADRYERKMEDLFDINDEITKKIITELHVEITDGERLHLYAKGTENLEAWIHFSKGNSYLLDWSKRENNIKAKEQFEQAIKIDPNFASAWIFLGLTHQLDGVLGWTENPAESFKQYLELTQKAISLDESSPLAHDALGQIYRRNAQFEKAIIEGEKAIALVPNNADFNFNLSQTMNYAGRSGEAVELIKKAMRLSPIYPVFYSHFLGMYLHCEGRYEEAITAYGKALERHKKTGDYNPLWVHYGLMASYLELNRIDNAGEHFKEALALDPNDNFIGWAKMNVRYKDKDLERLNSLYKPLRRMYTDTDIKTKQYVHEGPPAFKFEYPEGSKNLPLTSPNEILRMRTGYTDFNAYVADIPEGMKLEDFGPKFYLPGLKEEGTNIDLISNESITLKDGTKAYRAEIKWLVKGSAKISITTLLVAAYREDKCVYLTAHPVGNPEEVAWIVESLTFQ